MIRLEGYQPSLDDKGRLGNATVRGCGQGVRAEKMGSSGEQAPR